MIMRKRGRKPWWVVPTTCRSSSKKSLQQAESRMDIDQILKAKLETITEESEVIEDSCMLQFTKHRCNSMMKKEKKFWMKVAMGEGFKRPHISLKLKESYLLFMSGFVPRRCLGALPHC